MSNGSGSPFTFDVKGVVAVLVVIGAFLLMVIPIAENRVPDTASVGFASGGLMLVLGFYFGHINGAATTLANSATALAAQAIATAGQRRVGDPAPPPAPAGAVPVAAVVITGPPPADHP